MISVKSSLVQRQGFNVEYSSKPVARVQQVKSITVSMRVLTTSVTRPITEPPLAKQRPLLFTAGSAHTLP